SDNREAIAALKVPGLHLYAEQDALVPVSCASAAAALNPEQHVKVVAGSGHALHWDNPEQVMAHIETFIATRLRALPKRDKSEVARSFSRAAPTYESAARLQRQVGENLLQQIDRHAKCVLDLGAGT